MWEFLGILVGGAVFVGVFILPLMTFAAMKGLQGKIEALTAEIGVLRRLLQTARKPEAAAPPPCAPAPLREIPLPGAAAREDARPPTPAPVPPPCAPAPLREIPLPDAAARGDARPPTPAPLREMPLPEPPAVKPPREPSAVESAVAVALERAWNWVVVGEEFRKPGVSAEFAIATAWLVRVGVLVVVLAVGFGLQLSIARGVLGPTGRVSMSMLAGVAFVLLGIRCMTRRLEMLGQGFVGGGLALFYFAFYAMSVMFGLVDMRVAFGGMILVTVVSVVLATRLNALSIAVFGLIGGYLTPVVLKTPEPNYSVLYLYLLLLSAGMAGVALLRQWPVLTWLGFVFNSLLFYLATGGALEWAAGGGTAEQVAYLCGFFVLYSTAIFGYAVRYRVGATPLEVVALFVNALVAFAFGAFLLGHTETAERVRLSVLALGMAGFYVAHVWGLLVCRRVDRVLASGFIALVAIFLGVALPLLFTGHVLTCVFALQALAFLWLGRQLNGRMFHYGAAVFYAVTLVRMMIGFVDPETFAEVTRQTYLATIAQRLVEFAVPVASLFCASRVIGAPPVAPGRGVADVGDAWRGGLRVFSTLFMVAFYGVLLVYLSHEFFTGLRVFLPDARWAAVTVVWAAFAAYLLVWWRGRVAAEVFRVLAGLFCAAVAAQWLFFGWPTDLRLGTLCHGGDYGAATVFPRLLATLACLLILLRAWQMLAAGAGAPALRKALLRVANALLLLYLTFEAATFFNAYVPDFRKWSVSVVWGCYGLALLIWGLQFNARVPRMAGLLLFALTIAKVFLFDLSGSDVLYRLIAFAALGGVLLLGAYAYLRKQDVFKERL